MPSVYRAPNSKTSKTGEPIVADVRQLARIARSIRTAAPDAWKACRVALKAVAAPVLEDAKARANATGPKDGSQVSSRVADSLKIRVTSGGNVKIVGGGDAAPEAAAIENKGKGFVRHPTFGRRDNPGDWTEKNSRPAFLAPALEAHRAEVEAAIEKAVVDAVNRAIGGGL